MRVEESAILYEFKRGKPLPDLPDCNIEKKVSPFELPHPADRYIIPYEILNTVDEVESIPNDGPKIFTDGSKIEGKVGSAVSWWENGNEIKYFTMKLESYCSVFQAELIAIHRALRALSIKKAPPGIANILSDSRSALQCIEDPSNLHPIVFDIRKSIEKLKQAGCHVKLFWIKAHAGIPGNERADEIAKKAALTKKSAPVYDALPVSSAKWILRQETLNKWQSKYTNDPQGAVTKRFFPDIRQSYPIVKKLKLNNQLAQLFTGHGGFGEYLHKFNLKSHPYCNCDGISPESVSHVICKCPKFAYDRAKVELVMGFDIINENLRHIITNSNCKDIFIKYALKVICAVNKDNKSTNI